MTQQETTTQSTTHHIYQGGIYAMHMWSRHFERRKGSHRAGQRGIVGDHGLVLPQVRRRDGASLHAATPRTDSWLPKSLHQIPEPYVSKDNIHTQPSKS